MMVTKARRVIDVISTVPNSRGKLSTIHHSKVRIISHWKIRTDYFQLTLNPSQSIKKGKEKKETEGNSSNKHTYGRDFIPDKFLLPEYPKE